MRWRWRDLPGWRRRPGLRARRGRAFIIWQYFSKIVV
jgi:hypothetical protein